MHFIFIYSLLCITMQMMNVFIMHCIIPKVVVKSFSVGFSLLDMDSCVRLLFHMKAESVSARPWCSKHWMNDWGKNSVMDQRHNSSFSSWAACVYGLCQSPSWSQGQRWCCMGFSGWLSNTRGLNDSLLFRWGDLGGKVTPNGRLQVCLDSQLQICCMSVHSEIKRPSHCH